MRGDLAHARQSFRLAGVTREDTGDAWSGGADVHLVQTGDILDRGEDSIAILDVVADMTEQASAAGGLVTALLGNHELMTLQGDLSYVARNEITKLGQAALAAQNLGGEQMGTG